MKDRKDGDKVMKIGLLFGCFIPMHVGHLDMIKQAISENDKIILGVCGYAEDRGKDFINFTERQKLIRNKFAYNESVIISVVDDKKIGLTGKFDEEAWKNWSKEYFTNAGINPNDNTIEFTWYTGDKQYIDELSKIYPKHNFILLDKTRRNISGTEIREHLESNLMNIDIDFLRYIYATKVFS